MATNQKTGKKYAIKLFDKVLILSGDKEIQATKIVDHNHVVRHVDHGTTLIVDKYGDQELVNYLVIEYYPKGDLFDYIANTDYFSEDLARYYMHQLASALQHLHDKNIVHRDIKLENLLFNDEYNLKLIDLGFAG